MLRTPCPECRGTGKDIVFRNQFCGRCGGGGFVMTQEPDYTPQRHISGKSRFIQRVVYLLVMGSIIAFILYKLSR